MPVIGDIKGDKSERDATPAPKSLKVREIKLVKILHIIATVSYIVA